MNRCPVVFTCSNDITGNSSYCATYPEWQLNKYISQLYNKDAETVPFIIETTLLDESARIQFANRLFSLVKCALEDLNLTEGRLSELNEMIQLLVDASSKDIRGMLTTLQLAMVSFVCSLLTNQFAPAATDALVPSTCTVDSKQLLDPFNNFLRSAYKLDYLYMDKLDGAICIPRVEDFDKGYNQIYYNHSKNIHKTANQIMMKFPEVTFVHPKICRVSGEHVVTVSGQHFMQPQIIDGVTVLAAFNVYLKCNGETTVQIAPERIRLMSRRSFQLLLPALPREAIYSIVVELSNSQTGYSVNSYGVTCNASESMNHLGSWRLSASSSEESTSAAGSMEDVHNDWIIALDGASPQLFLLTNQAISKYIQNNKLRGKSRVYSEVAAYRLQLQEEERARRGKGMKRYLSTSVCSSNAGSKSDLTSVHDTAQGEAAVSRVYSSEALSAGSHAEGVGESGMEVEETGLSTSHSESAVPSCGSEDANELMEDGTSPVESAGSGEPTEVEDNSAFQLRLDTAVGDSVTAFRASVAVSPAVGASARDMDAAAVELEAAASMLGYWSDSDVFMCAMSDSLGVWAAEEGLSAGELPEEVMPLMEDLAPLYMRHGTISHSCTSLSYGHGLRRDVSPQEAETMVDLTMAYAVPLREMALRVYSSSHPRDQLLGDRCVSSSDVSEQSVSVATVDVSSAPSTLTPSEAMGALYGKYRGAAHATRGRGSGYMESRTRGEQYAQYVYDHLLYGSNCTAAGDSKFTQPFHGNRTGYRALFRDVLPYVYRIMGYEEWVYHSREWRSKLRECGRSKSGGSVSGSGSGRWAEDQEEAEFEDDEWDFLPCRSGSTGSSNTLSLSSSGRRSSRRARKPVCNLRFPYVSANTLMGIPADQLELFLYKWGSGCGMGAAAV